MNQKTLLRILPFLFLTALLTALVLAAACQKTKPPTEEVLPMDRVALSPVGTSQTVLHKTFSVEASHNQSVNVDLPASLDRPVKYYLVFRAAAAKGVPKVVEADFRVDF